MVLSYPLIHKPFSTNGFLLNLVQASLPLSPTTKTSNAVATDSFLICLKKVGAKD